MPRSYVTTYDRVTPESAEVGDFSDHGFGDPSTLGSTSIPGHVDTFPHGSDAWREEMEQAHAAATATVEPDEYDLDEAADMLDTDDDTPEARARVESYAAVRLMVQVLRDDGATEPNSSDASADGYYQIDGAVDYATGEETRLAYHLEGWSDAELAAIYAAITGRK
jgi:hypothetical protein